MFEAQLTERNLRVGKAKIKVKNVEISLSSKKMIRTVRAQNEECTDPVPGKEQSTLKVKRKRYEGRMS